MFESVSAWGRGYERDTLNRRVFILVITGLVAFGIAVTAAASTISLNWQFDQFGLLILAIGVLMVSLAGIFVAHSSDNPLVSLIGFMLVAVPFGILLGPVLNLYTEASIIRIFLMTAALVVGLGILGIIIPASLEGLGSWLFAGLWLLIFGTILYRPLAGLLGVPADEVLNWMDWIGIGIFSVYVVYDLNRAMRIPSTLNNAVDSAVSVYLDFLNLFIRLLALMGRKK